MCGAAAPSGAPSAQEAMVNIITKMQEQAQMAAITNQQVQAANQVNLSNVALVQQLQRQSDAIRAETEQRTAELAAAKAPVTTTTNPNPYSVTMGQGSAGVAQEVTTAAITPKRKPKATLQLGAETTMPGVGLNVGIG